MNVAAVTVRCVKTLYNSQATQHALDPICSLILSDCFPQELFFTPKSGNER